ncbi:MAG: hypothetical protein A4E74_01556 [Syntrophus sp. PtaB.Bin075]|nr:MAG: hypothetical protein A4E74_01556 [Syntrophus sp. PtaB.Bin075]
MDFPGRDFPERDSPSHFGKDIVALAVAVACPAPPFLYDRPASPAVARLPAPEPKNRKPGDQGLPPPS